MGEGEWATAKYGRHGTRGWKKLHVGVDRSGMIVAHALTDILLIDAVDGDLASVTADAAYDTVAFYEAAGARGASVVVPPLKTARVFRQRPWSGARDHTIRKVKELGRRRWKQVSGCHRQARVDAGCLRRWLLIKEPFVVRTATRASATRPRQFRRPPQTHAK